MALPNSSLSNRTTYLQFPTLPEPPEGADDTVTEWHKSLEQWYEDLILVLQRDREETLAKIKKLE